MRTCLALDLKDDPNLIAQYESLHKPGGIWPEIPEGIAAFIDDMQIYRIGAHLFMIVETPDGVSVEHAFQQVGTQPKQDEWAVFIGQFQKRLSDARSDEHWAQMEPVFLLHDHIQKS
jgi:L-rhamnose mutarotase